jgi:hypothetical protein
LKGWPVGLLVTVIQYQKGRIMVLLVIFVLHVLAQLAQREGEFSALVDQEIEEMADVVAAEPVVPSIFATIPNVTSNTGPITVQSRIEAVRGAVAEIQAGKIVIDFNHSGSPMFAALPPGWKAIQKLHEGKEGKIVIANDRFVFKSNAFDKLACRNGFAENIKDLVGTLFLLELGRSGEVRVDDLVSITSELFEVNIQQQNTPRNNTRGRPWENCPHFVGYIQERALLGRLYADIRLDRLASNQLDKLIKSQVRWAEFLFTHALLLEDMQFLVRSTGETVLFDTGLAQFVGKANSNFHYRCDRDAQRSCLCNTQGDTMIQEILLPLIFAKLQNTGNLNNEHEAKCAIAFYVWFTWMRSR